MINSNRKGKRGELAWSAKLTDAGFPARRGQQYAGGFDSADVICPMLDPILHNEVKAVERLNIHDAIRQAQADSLKGRMVYVAHKKSREQWLVTMPADDWLELVKLLEDRL